MAVVSWVSQGMGCSQGRLPPLAKLQLLEVQAAVEGTMVDKVGELPLVPQINWASQVRVGILRRPSFETK